MPRFYIDTDDGEMPIVDTEGSDLPDAAAARESALDALPDMARDQIPDGDQRVFTVSVRDANLQPVYVATLSLEGRWIERA